MYAKDTPNFIGNRIGVFSILATMHHTEAFGLGFDVVDALTGPAIGRPKSATYRTADVVGLDTMAHVIKTMADTLPDDPWHRYFAAPAWLAALIDKGALGQKTGAGIYRKVGKDILVLDVAQARLPAVGAGDERRSRRRSSRSRTRPRNSRKLRASRDPQAQFLWAMFRDLFHYSRLSTSPTSPTPRATSISRSAGVTAGSSARSRPGRPRAGRTSRSGSPRTSPPARR